jgi:hypothetical protein
MGTEIDSSSMPKTTNNIEQQNEIAAPNLALASGQLAMKHEPNSCHFLYNSV